MTKLPPVLGVALHGERVGDLIHNPSSGKRYFVFRSSYLEAPVRPVLGQAFLDEPRRRYGGGDSLPPWFANLVPEAGPTRDLVALKHGRKRMSDIQLLAALGADLPGAVTVTVEPHGSLEMDPEPGPPALKDPEGESSWRIKASLAGVQLKLSIAEDARGLVVPVTGLCGRWILKLPDRRYKNIPRNEWAMMSWARASGLDVPECRLLRWDNIRNLERSLCGEEEDVYVVRRFDRAPDGLRHIEDFAQVLDRGPEPRGDYKYNASFDTVAKVLAVLAPDSLDELLGRIIFCVASGNGDAHLKNWSLIYPDRLSARLSPAYDLVSTAVYGDPSLALSLAGRRNWSDIDRGTFEDLGRRLRTGLDMSAVVRRYADAIWTAFDTHVATWDLPTPWIAELRSRRDLPLFRSDVG